MTIINYLGCNFHLPLSEDDSDDKILISNFLMRQEVEKHFSTKYIYGIFAKEYGSFFLNDFHKNNPQGFRERQTDFQALIEFLDSHLTEGDYCELYTCWSGDEEEERDKEYDQTILLNQSDIDNVEIYEKTMLVIRK